MNKISNENQNLELIMPSLELIDQILSQRDLQKYDEAGSMNKEDQNGSMAFFKESIRSYNKLYVEMSRKLIEDGFNQDGEFDV
jgi:hypothetical protein